MAFQDIALRLLARPRVLHRVPGRLRVHIPILKMVPKEGRAFAPMFADLLSFPESIEHIDPCLVTGNLVIQYDSGQSTEREVLDYLDGMIDLVLRHRDRLAHIPQEKIPGVIERLEAFFREAMSERLLVDRNLEIPDDLLA